MAVVDVALVPEAFMEVTVRSSDGQPTHSGRRQKTTYKDSMQGNYWTASAIGRVHCHPSELLSRLDRGEEAWVPQIQSSDESADEGPIKPTLKRLPTGGTWWDRYRSPVTYPSSESANSDNDQESEEEKPHRGSYPHRGGFRPTILRRNLFNNSKGSGSQSLKPREAYKHGSQLKKPSESQLGKTKAETGNESSHSKERAAGRDHLVPCPDCGQIFKSKISLANHQRIHSTTKAYKCPDCKERFSSKKVLDRHQRGHRAEAGNRPSYSIVKPQNMKLYGCFTCKKSFELKEQFLLHQKSHTTQQPYKCHECGETFVQKELLDKHQNCHTTPKNNRKKDKKKEEKIESRPETEKKKDSTAPVSGGTRPLNIGLTRQQQDQVNLHKCQFCGKCLRFKSLLVDHERMHREARPYKCSQCSKSFLHKAFLMSHMMTHMKQASRKHPKKGKSLAVQSALVDSEISHKRGNASKRPVSRKIITRSSYRFWCPRNWAQKTPHQCQYCGKCLSTSIILADHEKLHTGERPYKCHKCTESFIRKHHLFRHLAIHLREFSNEGVKSHPTMRIIKSRHYGEKNSEGLLPTSDVTRRSGLATRPQIPTHENYVCQHCGKCMRTKSSFVNHGKIHRRKQQPYPHLEREENTSQEEPLVSRQKTHVGEQHSLCSDSKDKTVTKDPPTFSHRVPHRRKQPHLCHTCGKTFDDNYSFTRHQQIHSGQKPFKCAACGKAFLQMWHLKRHEKTHLKGQFLKQPVVREVIHENSHLDRKLFKCSLCGKGFFQPWHLKRHKRIHLNEECRKLSAIMEATRAHFNFPSSVASTEEGQLPLHTDEVISLPHAQEDEGDPLVPLEERSDTGAPEKHLTMPVQLSRKFQENILLGYGEVSQAVKSERRPRRKDIFSIHQPGTCSKNAHSQSHKKEKNHNGWQLRQRASSKRKSKGEMQLVGKRSHRCFCQREEREMFPPNTSSPPKKAKYCNGLESDPCVSGSSSFFQGASKNHKDLCLELPCQKTFSREAQMKGTKSVVQRNTVFSVAQERQSREANSSSQSCEKEKCKPSNIRDPAEIRSMPPLSKSKTWQDHDRSCPLNARSNATAQNLGRAPLAQQLGKIQNPLRIQKRVKGRRRVELQTAMLRKLQSSPSKGKTVCDQQMKHVCTRCKKSFRSRTNLLIHEKNHTENRPFPCTQCKKSFFSMTALKLHMRIHSGEKPFKCSECDFRCNALCNLNRHKASHS